MMLQAVLLLSAMCSISAFAPSGAMRNARTMVMSSTEKMVGASIEVNGGTHFQPILDYDQPHAC
jgi:hypothetical protein